MKGRYIIPIGLAIFGIEYGRFMKLMDSVSFATRNVRFGFEGGKIIVTFQLVVTNNSPKDIKIKNIKGRLFVGNTFLASYGTNIEQNIRANSTSALPITVVLNDQNIAQTISNLNLNTTTITLKTSSRVVFKALGFIGLPIGIKDETTIQAGEMVKELTGYLNKWIQLFKK